MRSKQTTDGEDTGRRRWRLFFLSLLFPGAGQFIYKDAAAAWSCVLLRMLAVIVPPMYLYDMKMSGVPVAGTALFIFIAVHLWSAIAAAFRYTPDSIHIQKTSIFCFISLLPLVLLITIWAAFFPVIKVRDAAMYPGYAPGTFVWCSVRAAAAYESGDVVVYRQDGALLLARVLCSEDSASADYQNGSFRINGEAVQQNVMSVQSLVWFGMPQDENIYTERSGDEWYFIYRYPSKEWRNKVTQLDMGLGQLLLCGDNRTFANPLIVDRNDCAARVELRIPFPNSLYAPSVPAKRGL